MTTKFTDMAGTAAELSALANQRYARFRQLVLDVYADPPPETDDPVLQSLAARITKLQKETGLK